MEKNLIAQDKGSLMKKKLCMEAKETKRFSCLLPMQVMCDPSWEAGPHVMVTPKYKCAP